MKSLALACLLGKKKKKAPKRKEYQKLPVPVSAAPWLVFLHKNKNNKQTFCSVSSPNQYHLRSIPKLHDKDMTACGHGWWLLWKKNSFSLWNPIVPQETIQLPELNLELEFCYALLTSPPSDSCSKVLLVDNENPRIVFCRPADDDWTIQDFSQELKYESICLRRECFQTFYKIATCNGVVYAISCLGKLFMIEDQTKKLVLKDLGVSSPRTFRDARINYLMESSGELLLVHQFFRGHSQEISFVQVHKMDFSQMSWIKMENLGDHALFLSCKGSVSCLAKEAGIDQNRIYFVSNDCETLFSFNPEQGSLSIVMVSPDIRNFQKSPYWIMPDLNLVDRQVASRQEVDNPDIKSLQSAQVKDYKEEVAEMENITNLPFDVLTLIAEHLVLVDYLSFRATSKSFRYAAPLDQCSMNPIGLESQMVYPWFMFSKKFGDGTFSLIDTRRNETYYITIPQSLQGARVFFSKEGWLLTYIDYDKCLSFFNPFTKVIHKIPELPKMSRDLHSLGFSSLPTYPDCCVVGMSCCYGPGVFVYCLQVGDEDWSEVSIEEEDFTVSNNTPVFHDNYFHFLGVDGRVAIFNFSGDEYSWDVLAKPPCDDSELNYLVECDGEIFSVFVGALGRWVKVFKLHFTEHKKAWIEVKNLGQNMFFVSHSSSFSAVAKIPGMENKIYFPRLLGQSLVFYSLETAKFHTFNSHISMEDFCLSSEVLLSNWIEPRC